MRPTITIKMVCKMVIEAREKECSFKAMFLLFSERFRKQEEKQGRRRGEE